MGSDQSWETPKPYKEVWEQALPLPLPLWCESSPKSECGCLPIKVYVAALKCEFQMIFMCHKILTTIFLTVLLKIIMVRIHHEIYPLFFYL